MKIDKKLFEIIKNCETVCEAEQAFQAEMQKNDVCTSQQVFEKMSYLNRKKQEEFYILLLNNKHSITGKKLITKGLINRSLVHPREVFFHAVKSLSADIICIHNHPSGNPEPSNEDIQITKRLKEAGNILGIPVLDHIIIGKGTYYSFADNGNVL